MRPPRTPPRLCTWLMSDGYLLHGRVWQPERLGTAPEAVIYLHGIQSHGGWFEWTASLLGGGNRPIIVPDRRGSGLNTVDRGHTPCMERWLVDIDEVAGWARREFGVKCFAVVGVSWGGKLAVAWARRRCNWTSRVLLISPGIFPAIDVGFRDRFRIFLSVLGGGKNTFPIPLDDPRLFTDNPQGQTFIANDELKLMRASANFFWHSHRLDRALKRIARGGMPVQTTLVLAGKDRIIRNRATEKWVRRIAGPSARVVTFSDQAHTLEFAADASSFGKFIEDWGQARAQKNA